MLRVNLICCGKLKEKFYTDACAEYEKRLQRYCSFELTELPETGDLKKEGEAILARIPAGAYVVALCIEGRLKSSEELAELVKTQSNRGMSRLVLLIGSSYGLDEKVKQRADLRLSMSPMTFPHHLARVMVLEQLYRAFSINEGGKYHK